ADVGGSVGKQFEVRWRESVNELTGICFFPKAEWHLFRLRAFYRAANAEPYRAVHIVHVYFRERRQFALDLLQQVIFQGVAPSSAVPPTLRSTRGRQDTVCGTAIAYRAL